MTANLTFTERLAKRRELWWDRPRLGGERTLRDALHRLRERRAFHTREDPLDAWRCCELWPRKVLNKWNGREFAARFGCPLPELYWMGENPDPDVLASLPGRYVAKPVFPVGRKTISVVVDGEDRLRGGPVSTSTVIARLPRSRFGLAPALVEEFIEPPAPEDRVPLELKVHVFGPEVATIHVLDRSRRGDYTFRFYTPQWSPIDDPINTFCRVADHTLPRPDYLDRLLELSSRIGAAIGTFMRIDFFAGSRGLVFNEFSSISPPQYYTAYADQWFGELWSRRAPGRS